MSKQQFKDRNSTDVEYVVADGRSIVDLWHSGLLEEVLRLPITVLVAHPVWAGNALSVIPRTDKESFARAGLRVIDLPGDTTRIALDLRGRFPCLEPEECFSIVLSSVQPGSNFVVSNIHLRSVAAAEAIRFKEPAWLVARVLATSSPSDGRLRECLAHCGNGSALGAIASVIGRHLGIRRAS